MIPVYITRAAAGSLSSAWEGVGAEDGVRRFLGEEETLRRLLELGASPSCLGIGPKRALGVRDEPGNPLPSG